MVLAVQYLTKRLFRNRDEKQVSIDEAGLLPS